MAKLWLRFIRRVIKWWNPTLPGFLCFGRCLLGSSVRQLGSEPAGGGGREELSAGMGGHAFSSSLPLLLSLSEWMDGGGYKQQSWASAPQVSAGHTHCLLVPLDLLPSIRIGILRPSLHQRPHLIRATNVAGTRLCSSMLSLLSQMNTHTQIELLAKVRSGQRTAAVSTVHTHCHSEMVWTQRFSIQHDECIYGEVCKTSVVLLLRLSFTSEYVIHNMQSESVPVCVEPQTEHCLHRVSDSFSLTQSFIWCLFLCGFGDAARVRKPQWLIVIQREGAVRIEELLRHHIYIVWVEWKKLLMLSFKMLDHC